MLSRYRGGLLLLQGFVPRLLAALDCNSSINIWLYLQDGGKVIECDANRQIFEADSRGALRRGVLPCSKVYHTSCLGFEVLRFLWRMALLVRVYFFFFFFFSAPWEFYMDVSSSFLLWLRGSSSSNIHLSILPKVLLPIPFPSDIRYCFGRQQARSP